MNPQRPFIVGLTGGIGSGKTAASDHFQRLGVPVVDADVVAREVVEPGMPALAAIAEHFGPGVIDSEGRLDRAALRRLIFDQPQERLWLESLLHPLIRLRTIEQLEAAQGPYVILVSPLLLETDQHKLVDRVLLIDVPEQLQIERTMLRDANSREEVEAILRAQSARSFKQQHASDIIVNDHDLNHLYQQVEQQHQRYLEQAKQHHARTSQSALHS